MISNTNIYNNSEKLAVVIDMSDMVRQLKEPFMSKVLSGKFLDTKDEAALQALEDVDAHIHNYRNHLLGDVSHD